MLRTVTKNSTILITKCTWYHRYREVIQITGGPPLRLNRKPDSKAEGANWNALTSHGRYLICGWWFTYFDLICDICEYSWINPWNLKWRRTIPLNKQPKYTMKKNVFLVISRRCCTRIQTSPFRIRVARCDPLWVKLTLGIMPYTYHEQNYLFIYYDDDDDDDNDPE